MLTVAHLRFMSTALTADLEKYCVFRQAKLLFALPANCVVEVAPNPVIVPMPASHPVLAGGLIGIGSFIDVPNLSLSLLLKTGMLALFVPVLFALGIVTISLVAKIVRKSPFGRVLTN